MHFLQFLSRLSITPFYVEATLLEALTYTWRLPRLNLEAKVGRFGVALSIMLEFEVRLEH